jgi:phosphotransferase system  glucose/maltose/N-acetylglucosamine-specific IIC component
MNSAANPASNAERKTDATSTGTTLYGIYVVSLAVCVLGNLAMRMGMEAGWFRSGTLAVALIGALTALPLFVAAGLFWKLLRRDLDELVQKIVLEGLGFALLIYVPLSALYVNLRTAGVWVPRLDPPDLLMAPAVLTALGVALAWRRYS